MLDSLHQVWEQVASDLEVFRECAEVCSVFGCEQRPAMSNRYDADAPDENFSQEVTLVITVLCAVVFADNLPKGWRRVHVLLKF